MSSHTITESAAVAQAARAGAVAPEYLSFRLGQEEYGIDILRVQEIRSYEAPTRIAGAPPVVLGVLNLRGAIVPIVDLRTSFGIEAGFDAATVTVVLNLGGRTVGIVVDGVSDVVGLAAGDVKPAPAFNGAVDAAHLQGIATLQQGERQRMLILLDIQRLMGAERFGLSLPALQ